MTARSKRDIADGQAVANAALSMAAAQREKEMTEHTPGPWQIDQDDVRRGVFHLYAWDRDLLERRIADPDIYDARDNANARLIAAAPELLEACETTLANLAPAYASEHLVIKRLRAAIAKARGQEISNATNQG